MSWLIDRSALIRLSASVDPGTWLERVATRQVRISAVTLLEMGYAVQTSAAWHAAIEGPPLALLPREPMSKAIEDRALHVQGLLADRGQHRAPSIADLLLAATAELAGHVVLRIDKDYDLITAVTGQPVERLALA